MALETPYRAGLFRPSFLIDLAFANSALLPLVTDVCYLAGGISDQTPHAGSGAREIKGCLTVASGLGG